MQKGKQQQNITHTHSILIDNFVCCLLLLRLRHHSGEFLHRFFGFLYQIGLVSRTITFCGWAEAQKNPKSHNKFKGIKTEVKREHRPLDGWAEYLADLARDTLRQLWKGNGKFADAAVEDPNLCIERSGRKQVQRTKRTRPDSKSQENV